MKFRVSAPSECSVCGVRAIFAPSHPALCCSGCDAAEVHLACLGLGSHVPEDPLLCGACNEARRRGGAEVLAHAPGDNAMLDAHALGDNAMVP